MALSRQFSNIKDDLMAFIIANPCVSSIDLMIHFRLEENWRRSELLRPLKNGYGINGNKQFLFSCVINKIAYYFEMGYAIDNNIPDRVSIEESKLFRNQKDRARSARERLELKRHKLQENERLMDYTRVMHMMKVPETV